MHHENTCISTHFQVPAESDLRLVDLSQSNQRLSRAQGIEILLGQLTLIRWRIEHGLRIRESVSRAERLARSLVVDRSAT